MSVATSCVLVLEREAFTKSAPATTPARLAVAMPSADQALPAHRPDKAVPLFRICHNPARTAAALQDPTAAVLRI